MSLANVIPSEVMSALVVDKMRKLQVAGDVVNRNYSGVITGAGDSVKIPSVGDITVSDHTKNSTITYSPVDSSSQVLNIDQAKKFAVAVDSVDEVQAIMNLVPVLVDKGAYELSDAADIYLLQTTMENGAQVTGGSSKRALGTAATPIVVSADTTVNYLSRLQLRLDEENVPTEGRFCVCPSWFHSYLTQEKILETAGSVNADDQFSNGKVGRAFGFDIRVSNNVKNAKTTASRIFAGHVMSTTFAEQLIELTVKDLETQFGTGVRGLYVYGAKVIQGKALAKGIISQG